MSEYDEALRYLQSLNSRNGHIELAAANAFEELRLAALLEVIPHNRPLEAKQIAKLVGRKNSARLRRELSLLCKRGLICRAQGTWGYLRVVTE